MFGELVSPSLSGNGDPVEAREHLAYWSKLVEQEDLRERLAFMDIHTHLEPRLLRDLDAMSMAHSIEVRPVLLDHRLVEFLLRVPSSIRIQHKRLLLDATKTFMPPALLRIWNPGASGHSHFHFKQWLTHDLRGLLKEAFAPERHSRGRHTSSRHRESPLESLRAVRRRGGVVAYLESFRLAAMVRTHAGQSVGRFSK